MRRIERERAADLAQRAHAFFFGVRTAGERVLGRDLGGARVGLRHLAHQLQVLLAVEVALDRVVQLADRGEAVLLVELRRLHADRVELGGNAALRRAERRPAIRAGDGRAHHARDRAARVQRLQRQHLVQDRAERVHVGARVHARGLAARLLRRHVAGRAEHGAVERVGAAVARQRDRPLAEQVGQAVDLRQAPVEHVHLAEVAEHDVARLQVAVQHAARVREVDREARGRERAQQLPARVVLDEELVLRVQPIDDLFDRLAVDALHREADAAVGRARQIVDRDDRRVLELTLDARLAHEARDGVRMLRVALAQHLHRHVTADARVVAQMDAAHAAFAEHRALQITIAVVHRVRRQAARRQRIGRSARIGAARDARLRRRSA